MSIEKHFSGLRSSASTIIRDRAGLDGPRTVTDEAATILVKVFPFSAISAEAACADLYGPSTYVLANRHQRLGYVGSAGELYSRLKQHAADPEKAAFATDVFAICGSGSSLDYESALRIERLLKHAIEEAGVARLLNRVEPRTAKLPASRLISIDRKFSDALHLLHDAGLDWLVPMRSPADVPEPSPEPVESVDLPAPENREAVDDDGDEGLMEVGVTTVPLGVEEQTLCYGGLWARGYQCGDKFIVAAGSEMRRVPNPSANKHTTDRRERLVDLGVAVDVPGSPDRLRLQVAVAFSSKPIAAKVLAGAHVGNEKWRALCAPRPVVVAS